MYQYHGNAINVPANQASMGMEGSVVKSMNVKLDQIGFYVCECKPGFRSDSKFSILLEFFEFYLNFSTYSDFFESY